MVNDHPELRERDLLKRAQLAGAIEEVLGARGIDDLTARLTAALALLAYDSALSRWAGERTQDFPAVLTGALHDLLDRAATLSGSRTAANTTWAASPAHRPARRGAPELLGG